MNRPHEPPARLLLSPDETRTLLALLAIAPTPRKRLTACSIVLYTLCMTLVIVPMVLDLLGIGCPIVIVDAARLIVGWLKAVSL